MRRVMRQPGSSRSRRKAVRPLRASSEVLATTMKCLASPAPVMNHLRPVHHPGVAAARGGGEHHRRVGAAARMRLGHGERGAHRSVDDGLQPALLLRRRAHLVQQDHVAVVGRGAVRAHRAEERVVELLVARGHADDAAVPGRRAPSASAAPTGLPPSPWRAAARAAPAGCSRARRRSPASCRRAGRGGARSRGSGGGNPRSGRAGRSPRRGS